MQTRYSPNQHGRRKLRDGIKRNTGNGKRKKASSGRRRKEEDEEETLYSGKKAEKTKDGRAALCIRSDRRRRSHAAAAKCRWPLPLFLPTLSSFRISSLHRHSELKLDRSSASSAQPTTDASAQRFSSSTPSAIPRTSHRRVWRRRRLKFFSFPGSG